MMRYRQHPILLVLAWLATAALVVHSDGVVNMELVPVDDDDSIAAPGADAAATATAAAAIPDMDDNGLDAGLPGQVKDAPVPFQTVLSITHLVATNVILHPEEEDSNKKNDDAEPFGLSTDEAQRMETMIRETYNHLAAAEAATEMNNAYKNEDNKCSLPLEPNRFVQVTTLSTNLVTSGGMDQDSTAEGSGPVREGLAAVPEDDADQEGTRTTTLAKLEIQYSVSGLCQGCRIKDFRGIEKPWIFKDGDSIEEENGGCHSRPVSLDHFRASLQQNLEQNRLQDEDDNESVPFHGRLLLTTFTIIDRVYTRQEDVSLEEEPVVAENNIDAGVIAHYDCYDENPVAIQSSLLLELPGDWTDYSNSSSTTTAASRKIIRSESNDTAVITLIDVEEIFLETYNHLTFQLCDGPYFRKVVNVIAERSTGLALNRTGNTTLISFEVEAECRNNCPSALPLFDLAFDAETNQDLVPPDATEASVLIMNARQGNAPQLLQSDNVTATSSCSCSADNDHQGFRPPTVEVFTAVFQQAVLDALPGVNATNATLEKQDEFPIDVENVACSANFRTFTSYVFVELEVGSGPLKESEKQTLGEAFRDIYNRLSFLTCDTFFRSILEAKLEENDGIRLRILQEQGYEFGASDQDAVIMNTTQSNHTMIYPNATNSTNNETITIDAPPRLVANGAMFAVSGQCRDCPVTEGGSFALFDDSFRRRGRRVLSSAAEPTELPPFAPRRNVQENVTSCICPANITAEELSIGTFLLSYNARIEELQQEGLLVTVRTVQEMQEGQQVQCGAGEVQTFTSTIYADATLNLDGLSREHQSALETLFQDSYNGLAFNLCDEQFRSIVDVHMESSDTFPFGARRGLQQGMDSITLFNGTTHNVTSNATDAPSSAPTMHATTVNNNGGTTVFSITGQCRNCELTESSTFGLFDQAFRRRKLLDESQNYPDRAPAFLSQELQLDDASNGAVCICPVGVEPGDNAGIWLEAFQAIFTKNIEEEQEKNGTLEDVQLSVDNLVEGQEVSCSGEVQLFTTTVYVEVSLSLDELSDEQRAILESTFKDSYNGQAFGLCDEYHRNVVDVNLETETSDEIFANRRLQNATAGTASNFADGTFKNETYSNYSIPQQNLTGSKTTLFLVTGSCRDCPVTESGGFRLFDDSFRRKKRRALQVSDETDTRLPRSLQLNSTGSCVCPIGLQPGDNDGPQMIDFKVIFNTRLEKAQENGLFGNISVAAEELIEGQPVECGTQESEFKSEVFSDLQVNLTSLTFAEVSVLESAFQKIYNNLAFALCDGYFRTLGKVQLRIGQPETMFPNRRLQEDLNFTDFVGNITNTTMNMTNSSSFENETEPPTVPTYVGSTLFTVTGKCRDCPVSESGYFNIFDDSFRRRSLTETKNLPDIGNMRRGLLLDGDTCICPSGVHPGLDQGPTAIDFEARFIELLDKLTEEGEIASVATTADNVVEGQEVSCDPEVQEFQTTAYTDLGTNPALLTLEEIAVLESSFREAYNLLSFSLCDGFFRIVADVKIVLNGTKSLNSTLSRRLQEDQEGVMTAFSNTTGSGDLVNATQGGNSTGLGIFTNATIAVTPQKNTTDPFPPANPAVFVITGRCRNCPVLTTGGFSLFDDAFRRSLSKPRRSKALRVASARRMQEELNVCICPPGVEPTLEPEITAEEFMREFNIIIQQKAKELGIAVKSVMEIVELRRGDPITSQPTGAPTDAQTDQLTSPAPSVRPATISPSSSSNTNQPTPDPSAQSTPGPTNQPTPDPTAQPTPGPTNQPTSDPTNQPIPSPTAPPTAPPTQGPTNQPALSPTALPTALTTPAPTADPTLPPTTQPTPAPTMDPTQQPSSIPSSTPSSAVCSETFFNVQANYYVLFLGNTSAAVDSDLTASFWAGDAAVNKTVCSHVLQNATVVRRISRRRLQDGATSTITSQYSVATAQTDTRSLYEDAGAISAWLEGCTKHPVMLENGIECIAFQSSTASPTPAPSMTPSGIPSGSPSGRPSNSPLPIPRSGPSSPPSLSPSRIPSTMPSTSPSAGPSAATSSLPSVSAVPSAVPSDGPSASAGPSSVPSIGPSESAGPSVMPSTSPSVGPSAATSSLPSVSTVLSAAPSDGPSESAGPSSIPSTGPSESAGPSSIPSIGPSESAGPSVMPSTSPSARPSTNLSSGPSVIPSSNPSSQPNTILSHVPSAGPSTVPSSDPSLMPSTSPSAGPSTNPSSGPSVIPSSHPFSQPSTIPSHDPSAGPSTVPSSDPSAMPSTSPSAGPSAVTSSLPSVSTAPSTVPSDGPSESTGPSSIPSTGPSESAGPSVMPSTIPSAGPSTNPSAGPSVIPSSNPSSQPSTIPSSVPSTEPSVAPSIFPSSAPSTEPACFVSNRELVNVLAAACVDGEEPCTDYSELEDKKSATSMKYGYPMSDWCMGAITSFDDIFFSYSGPVFDLSLWDVSKITSMTRAFSQSKFNASIGAIGDWDTSSVVTLASAFAFSAFEGDVSDWDTSSVTKMDDMLQGVGVDMDTTWVSSLASWDVSSVTTFQSMFSGTNIGSAVGDLGGWDINLDVPVSMSFMFSKAKSIPNGLSFWDMSEVFEVDQMFQQAKGFENINFNIGSWKVQKVKSASGMFQETTTFNIDISGWEWASVTNLNDFLGCGPGPSCIEGTPQVAVSFRQNLCPWNGSLNPELFLSNMFSHTNCQARFDPGESSGGAYSPLCFLCEVRDI